jgi:hypothetical protein
MQPGTRFVSNCLLTAAVIECSITFLPIADIRCVAGPNVRYHPIADIAAIRHHA